MVAPNGARLTTNDHPHIPVTIEQIVNTAIECKANGADGIHAHVRDNDQKHILDAGLYKELLTELERKIPNFYVQITTEAVGQYTSQEQRQLVRDVMPKAVSFSVAEMMEDTNDFVAKEFYHWAYEADIKIQHIFYSTKDVARFFNLTKAGVIPKQTHQLLFVLGKYTENKQSLPKDLDPYLTAIKLIEPSVDWAICAFGVRETDCLQYATQRGGKVRIGFENNVLNRDKSVAKNNAERVTDFLNA